MDRPAYVYDRREWVFGHDRRDSLVDFIKCLKMLVGEDGCLGPELCLVQRQHNRGIYDGIGRKRVHKILLCRNS
jgi:hypothetical protein